MTMFHTFTDRIPKNRITLFTDFISSVRPFGIVRSGNATIGIPTDVYSNDNSDCLGTVTCTIGTGTSGVVIANRIGIFNTADLQASLINRAWNIRNGVYAMEARLKTSVHPSASNTMTCGFILNHNTAIESGAFFYHLNGQNTWRAAVAAGTAVPGMNIIGEFDTGLPVSQYQVLRVESKNAARNFEFFANGRRVWKFVFEGFDAFVSSSSLPMPSIELRDRVEGGGGRGNSFTADYMLVDQEFVR